MVSRLTVFENLTFYGGFVFYDRVFELEVWANCSQIMVVNVLKSN